MNPVLQEYVPGQEAEVVSLLRETIPLWRSLDPGLPPEKHWKWKHRDGPLGPSLVSVAVAGGQVVGCNHSMPLRLRTAGGVRFCSYACDGAVGPQYRKRGLFYRIVDHSNGLREKAGIEANYFTTLNAFLIKPYSRDYPTLPLDCTTFLKVRDVRLHLRRKPSKNRWVNVLGYILLTAKNCTVKSKGERSANGKELSVRTISRFDERADDFWAAAAPAYSFIQERTSGFLNWRFCDPRSGGFTVSVGVERDNMIAYIVTKTDRADPGYPQGYIADVLALPGRTDAAESLIRSAVGQMHESGANAVRCLLPKASPYAAALRRCGFLDTRQRQPMFIDFRVDYRIAAGRASLGAPGTHHFTYADLDIV